MEMRSGARAAPVWDWRCFLRGSVGFYAQATGVQEENQIGRGAAKKSETDSVLFGRWPLAFFGLLACLTCHMWLVASCTQL